MKYSQPVISRETRLLLATILLSVVALWVLARIRFQEQPAAADPVPPVLAQLRPQSSVDDMARLVADLRTTIGTWVFAVDGNQSALRLRDVAVTLGTVEGEVRVWSDRPTGLTLVKSPSGDSPGPMPWVPRVTDYPRYLVAAELVEGKLLLRPVFVSALVAMPSALWGADVWRVADTTALLPGTFVFTTQGGLAGLTVPFGRGVAIVPGAHLLMMVDRALRQDERELGDIGLLVETLTPTVAAATGAAHGMVVTAVDSAGPAAAVLRPTDVIEFANGRPVPTLDHWRAVVERVPAGEAVHFTIRRGGAVQEVQVVAASDWRDSPAVEDRPAALTPPTQPPQLGLRLRTLPGRGAQVVAVEPESSAGRAGLREGDLITVAGQWEKPTSAQVTNLFRDLDAGVLLVAVSRGDEHRVLALHK